MSRIPAYEKVYQQLKKEILDEEFSVGEFLPTESSLEKRFKVSRTTVRKAVELLSRENIVSVKQGRGTQVLEYKTQQNLNLVTSVSETLRKKGYDVKARSIYIDSVSSSVSQAERLKINTGDELVRIQRVLLADDKPIAIMKNYLLPEMVPGIETYTDPSASLYQFLETKYNIHINSAKNKISAKIAGFSEAEMLGKKAGEALLNISRTCYMDGEAVCLDSIKVLGDFYEFEVFMEGRSHGE